MVNDPEARDALKKLALTPSGVTPYDATGNAVSLDACVWLETAPCGCMSAAIMAVVGEVALLSEKAARESLADNNREALSKSKQGFEYMLVRMEDYRTSQWTRVGECPHDPPWGVNFYSREFGGVTFERRTGTAWIARRKKTDVEWWVRKMSEAWFLHVPLDSPNRPPRPIYLGGSAYRSLALASIAIRWNEDKKSFPTAVQMLKQLEEEQR